MSAAPTWYDVLGVERDAGPEEIRSAWREATDRARPGSGQFRSANQAAETLLDPARRAAYDASLGEPAPEPMPDPVERPAEEPVEEPAEEPVEEPVEQPVTRSRAAWLGSVPVLVVLGVAIVLVAALTVWLGTKVSAQADLAEARLQAPVAAEQAAVAMLSYDYRKLPDDRARAEGFLTGDFKQQFLDNFKLLEKQKDGSPGLAVQTKTVTTAQVRESGVMGVDDGGRTARVLLFVNQTSEKQGQDPQVFLNRVAMTMRLVDDRWLVSALDAY